ncbi:XFP-like protein [Lentzea flaviverrucosa]|uniref:Xylulose-5-phosphate/fructose-6-phosphate phosphoketolase n=1 Tax=Lentzea flaviverrucosa TaxID=200379 RepID=A0A1H9BR11_9PSEU|nr:XFP-like protein [Lentzea flaviverrucosa]SEP91131.1 xylulose-5-phosphate/fructose-6-phosphate phosphoketolase [Lentzea flaviverrucosa]
MLVTGPVHGAPAVYANLWLEGTHAELDPALGLDEAGLVELVRRFSWPGGFPSHLSPEVPGVIHEGGELGYALATAFGAALDKPDLLVACLVGDGEAGTGPTAGSWHANKYLDPRGRRCAAGAAPNGYKISSPTICGCMSDEKLTAYFSGAGWSQDRLGGVTCMDVILGTHRVGLAFATSSLSTSARKSTSDPS